MLEYCLCQRGHQDAITANYGTGDIIDGVAADGIQWYSARVGLYHRKMLFRRSCPVYPNIRLLTPKCGKSGQLLTNVAQWQTGERHYAAQQTQKGFGDRAGHLITGL